MHTKKNHNKTLYKFVERKLKEEKGRAVFVLCKAGHGLPACPNMLSVLSIYK